MAISDDFILQLKQANPIESVMGSYVALKRSSRDYVCLCPFHSEKTPSCHINVGKQFFHCFGCHAGGDVITFIMKAENLEYIEAVRFLAERAGIPMPEDRGNDVSRLKARILEINRIAARYFNNILMRGEKGRLYFRSRQLSAQTITKYGLGYAPDDWHGLERYLKSQGCTEEELVASDLCRRSRKDGVFDFFRDRVMFPIIDLRGNVIAFGGRVIDGDGPKYLNTSDTLVFKKSLNLFSMNFAKRSNERRLILAEGYMDVIAVNQGGFENVVATLGTALTSEQARLMSQYADEVVIAYDSDGAGQAAAARAINLLGEVGVATRIIKMEGAKDPDEYIKKFGSLRFKQLLDNSEGAVNFRLAKCKEGLDLSSDTGKVEYLNRCVNVLADINSSLERGVYISKVAKEQDFPRETLDAQIREVIRKRINSEKKQEWTSIRTFSEKRKQDPNAVMFPKEYKAERGIISFLAKNPDGLELVTASLTPQHFITELNRRIYEKMVEGLKNSEDFNILSLQSEFSPDEMGTITEMLLENENIDINERAVRDFIEVLTKHNDREEEKTSASALSDDEFLKLTQRLKSRRQF